MKKMPAMKRGVGNCHKNDNKKNSVETLKKDAADKNTLIREMELKEDGLLLQEKMKKLKEEMELIVARIETICNQGEQESVSWSERESLYEQMDNLDKDLQIKIQLLKELDEQYHLLREEVNHFYKKEIMKNLPSSLPTMEMEDVEDNNEDWWKRE